MIYRLYIYTQASFKTLPASPNLIRHNLFLDSLTFSFLRKIIHLPVLDKLSKHNFFFFTVFLNSGSVSKLQVLPILGVWHAYLLFLWSLRSQYEEADFLYIMFYCNIFFDQHNSESCYMHGYIYIYTWNIGVFHNNISWSIDIASLIFIHSPTYCWPIIKLLVWRLLVEDSVTKRLKSVCCSLVGVSYFSMFFLGSRLHLGNLRTCSGGFIYEWW